MHKRSRNQVIEMIANAKVSAHEKWNYGEYEQPKTTLKTIKKKQHQHSRLLRLFLTLKQMAKK